MLVNFIAIVRRIGKFGISYNSVTLRLENAGLLNKRGYEKFSSIYRIVLILVTVISEKKFELNLVANNFSKLKVHRISDK